MAPRGEAGGSGLTRPAPDSRGRRRSSGRAAWAAAGCAALAACAPGELDRVLTPDPSAPLQVRAFVAPAADGPWTEAGTVARSFSSLHAAVVDGELLVAGLQSEARPGWWEERFPRLFVDVLRTRDLATWTATRWPVDAPGRSLIDPALVEGPEGLELWFVQVEGAGDPAEGRKASEVVRTRFDGDGFGRAETWAVGAGLVDPAPAWWRGAWHVFATRDRRDVVEVLPDGAVRVVLGGATVPFARADGDRLVLLAQRDEHDGVRPVEIETRDGATWSAPRPHALAAADLRTCASPVTAALGGRAVLLCVDERSRGR